LDLPQDAPAGPIEILEVRDVLRIGNPGHPILAVILIAGRAALRISRGGQIALSIIGILHRAPNGIGDARDTITPIVVEQELAPVRPGDRRDPAAAPGIRQRIPIAIDLLRQPQIRHPKTSTECDAKDPFRAVFPLHRRHAAGGGQHRPLHQAIGEIAIGTVGLLRQRHPPPIAELEGPAVGLHQQHDLGGMRGPAAKGPGHRPIGLIGPRQRHRESARQDQIGLGHHTSKPIDKSTGSSPKLARKARQPPAK